MQSSASAEENCQQVERLVAGVAASGARLVVLPEMWLCMGSTAQIQAALALQQSILRFMCELARKHGIWLVGGSMPWLDGQPAQQEKNAADAACERKPQAKPRARCWVINADGEAAGYYDKIHLFDVEVADGVGRYAESDVFAAGSAPVVLDTPFGRLGLAICYDLRFPELFRRLWQAGAELVAIPSAFTAVTGRAHWRSLLRARAIENSCYMLAANQFGTHDDKRCTWGHSMIVGPWGEELACIKSEEGVLLADIDREQVAAIRQRMPCHLHQKLIT